MTLPKAVLLASFGRNSRRPFTAALARLTIVSGLAVGLSICLVKVTTSMPLYKLPDSSALICTIVLVVQSAVMVALLASQGITRISNDSLARLLCSLPLNNYQRWLLLMLPRFIVVVITLLLIGWPLTALASRLGLHPLLSVSGIVISAVTALGCLYGLPVRKPLAHVVSILLLLWTEYKLVGLLNAGSTSIVAKTGVWLIFGVVICGLCCLFVESNKRLVEQVTRTAISKNIFGGFLPPATWFFKKIARSKTTQVGLVTSFGISVVLFIVLRRYHADVSTYVLPATLLAATFTSDIRSLCRRRAPAEIVALRGTTHFVLAQSVAIYSISIVAVLPLIIGAVLVIDDYSSMVTMMVHITFGVSIGLLASTLVVPGHRDVLGQLLATLLCSSIVIITPFLPGIKSFSSTAMLMLYIGITFVLVATAWLMEWHRNHFTWRKS